MSRAPEKIARAELGLARHAADIDAGAAQDAALDHHDLRAALGRGYGGRKSTTARTNDDQVVPIPAARMAVPLRRLSFGGHALRCARAILRVGERRHEANGVDAGGRLETRLTPTEDRCDVGGASRTECLGHVPFAISPPHSFNPQTG